MCDFKHLNDRELIRLVISEKQGESVTDNLFAEFDGSLSSLIMESDEMELIKVKGIGKSRAYQIKAVAELARRITTKPINSKTKISSPDDAANLVSMELRFLKQEVLKVILMDTKNQVISIDTLSMGGLNSSIVYPPIIFKAAVKKSAASFIICHNHPSGDPTPSQEDINITQRLSQGGKLIGIELLDHIIIGDGNYVSLKEKNIF